MDFQLDVITNTERHHIIHTEVGALELSRGGKAQRITPGQEVTRTTVKRDFDLNRCRGTQQSQITLKDEGVCAYGFDQRSTAINGLWKVLHIEPVRTTQIVFKGIIVDVQRGDINDDFQTGIGDIFGIEVERRIEVIEAPDITREPQVVDLP